MSVFGTDLAGRPFSQNARAVSLKATEVTLEGLRCTLKLNDVVGLRHGGQKARFRVVWVGSEGTPQRGQVGLRALEPEKNIWGAPTEKPAEKPALVPKPAFAGHDRRKHTRIPCSGSVKFRREGAGTPDSGRLVDLSEGGCYVETVSTAARFSRLDLMLNTEGLELRAVGVVQASHPGFGMGIAFGEMSPAYHSRLREWVFQHSKE